MTFKKSLEDFELQLTLVLLVKSVRVHKRILGADHHFHKLVRWP